MNIEGLIQGLEAVSPIRDKDSIMSKLSRDLEVELNIKNEFSCTYIDSDILTEVAVENGAFGLKFSNGTEFIFAFEDVNNVVSSDSDINIILSHSTLKIKFL